MNHRIEEDLITKHRRLVLSMAKNFKSSTHYLDLVQSGYVGLCRAMQTYDPQTGNSFATYATPWARKEMLDYLRTGTRQVHRSGHEHWKARRVQGLVDRVYTRTGIRLQPETEGNVSTDVHDIPWQQGEHDTRLDKVALMIDANRAAAKISEDKREILQAVASGSSLTDYGNRRGYSRERARQVYEGALASLRFKLAVDHG